MAMIILPTTFIESSFPINLNKYRPRWQNYGKKEQHKLGSTMEYVIINILSNGGCEMETAGVLWVVMFTRILHQILVPQLSFCSLCNLLFLHHSSVRCPGEPLTLEMGFHAEIDAATIEYTVVCFPRSLFRLVYAC